MRLIGSQFTTRKRGFLADTSYADSPNTGLLDLDSPYAWLVAGIVLMLLVVLIANTILWFFSPPLRRTTDVRQSLEDSEKLIKIYRGESP